MFKYPREPKKTNGGGIVLDVDVEMNKNGIVLYDPLDQILFMVQVMKDRIIVLDGIRGFTSYYPDEKKVVVFVPSSDTVLTITNESEVDRKRYYEILRKVMSRLKRSIVISDSKHLLNSVLDTISREIDEFSNSEIIEVV